VLDRFEGMETQVLGLSVDSADCLKAWAESLGGITYPLLSDFWPHGEVARAYGVLRSEGFSERAIFVIGKDGSVCYVDVHDIAEQPNNDVLFGVLAELEPQHAALQRAADAARTPAPAPAADVDVVVYCTPWCPGCLRARAYLKELGVKFAEIDITRDREAAKRVREWAKGFETTPTFNVRGTVVVDWRKDQLEAALKAAGVI